MQELIAAITAAFPVMVPALVVSEALAVAADLSDGDTHLSEQNRARIGLAIETAKNGAVQGGL